VLQARGPLVLKVDDFCSEIQFRFWQCYGMNSCEPATELLLVLELF
jgi:hypothetical protein